MEENVKVEEKKSFIKKPQIKRPAFKKPSKDFGKGAALGTVVGGLAGFIGRGFLDRARNEDDDYETDDESITEEE